jgi:hypothetical protein
VAEAGGAQRAGVVVADLVDGQAECCGQELDRGIEVAAVSEG